MLSNKVLKCTMGCAKNAAYQDQNSLPFIMLAEKNFQNFNFDRPSSV